MTIADAVIRDDRTRATFPTVLLASEGTDGAARCAPWLSRVAGPGRVRLLALLGLPPAGVSVAGRVVAYADQREDEARLRARAALRRVAADLRDRGFDVSIDARFGAPVPTILDAARHADLIALAAATARRRFAWWPSAVDEVLRHAPVPVFVVRRGQRAA